SRSHCSASMKPRWPPDLRLSSRPASPCRHEQETRRPGEGRGGGTEGRSPRGCGSSPQQWAQCPQDAAANPEGTVGNVLQASKPPSRRAPGFPAKALALPEVLGSDREVPRPQPRRSPPRATNAAHVSSSGTRRTGLDTTED